MLRKQSLIVLRLASQREKILLKVFSNAFEPFSHDPILMECQINLTKFSSLSLLRKAVKISPNELKRDSKIAHLLAKPCTLNAYISITTNEQELHKEFKKEIRKSYFRETSI